MIFCHFFVAFLFVFHPPHHISQFQDRNIESKKKIVWVRKSSNTYFSLKMQNNASTERAYKVLQDQNTTLAIFIYLYLFSKKVKRKIPKRKSANFKGL